MNTSEFSQCVTAFAAELGRQIQQPDLVGAYEVLQRNDPFSVEIQITSPTATAENILERIARHHVGRAIMTAFEYVGFVQGLANSREVRDDKVVMTFNFHVLRLVD